MGICASNNNMGNSNKRAATEQPKTKKKKFKSAVSKYGPYKQSLDKEGNKTWSAPNNKEWPTFDKESDLRQWLLKHVSLSDQNDQTIIRKPGTLEGTQFLINNCKNCHFWLLDFTSTITVDKCEKCTFYIGPCESSFFIRDSKNCSAVMAVGQLRTRDCHNMKILLYSQTEPVIEKSTNMKFGCFHSSYFNLSNQMQLIGLNEWQNRWCDIHDFTPGSGNHWSQLPPWTTAFDLLGQLPPEIRGDPSWTEYGSEDVKKNINEKINGSYAALSAIPYTYGKNERETINTKKDTNLFIFFTSLVSNMEMNVKEYCKNVCQSIFKLNLIAKNTTEGNKDTKTIEIKENTIRLVRSKSFQLESDMIDRLFQNSSDNNNSLKKTKNNCLFDISVGIHLIVPNGMIEAVENIVTIESNNTNSNNIFLWKSNSAELRMFFDEFKLSEST